MHHGGSICSALWDRRERTLAKRGTASAASRCSHAHSLISPWSQKAPACFKAALSDFVINLQFSAVRDLILPLSVAAERGYVGSWCCLVGCSVAAGGGRRSAGRGGQSTQQTCSRLSKQPARLLSYQQYRTSGPMFWKERKNDELLLRQGQSCIFTSIRSPLSQGHEVGRAPRRKAQLRQDGSGWVDLLEVFTENSSS